jgi:hydroxylamine reductase
MFCYQCEQTSKGEGCETLGVCGKDETTAILQDLLIHAVKGISMFAYRAKQQGAADPEIDHFTIEAIFATLTNVNFDPERLTVLIQQAVTIRQQARTLYEDACAANRVAPETLNGPAAWQPASTREGLLAQGQETLLPVRFLTETKEITNLQELVLYGIKGVAAYAAHAHALGGADPVSYAVIHEILDSLTRTATADQLLGAALRVGELNYRVMELLDKTHTDTFGHPQPAKLRIFPKKRFSFPDTISATCGLCLNRRRDLASTSTRTARCCRRTAIPSSRPTNTWLETTAGPGSIRRTSLLNSPAQSS